MFFVYLRSMSMQERIIKSIAPLVDDLNHADIHWTIFGSAALLLNGIELNVNDIDILLSREAAELLERKWRNLRATAEKSCTPTGTGLFRSRLSRYLSAGLPIELSGGLELRKGTAWQPVTATEIYIGEQGIHYCSLADCVRLLHTFDRPKDKERLKLIAQKKKTYI